MSKRAIQKGLTLFTSQLVIAKDLLKHYDFSLKKPQFKCKNIWYLGPDQVIIRLSKKKIKQIINAWVKSGNLTMNIQFPIEWRIYSGQFEINIAEKTIDSCWQMNDTSRVFWNESKHREIVSLNDSDTNQMKKIFKVS